MTKYRAKSAEVLNGADAFEQRLNWTLFTLEQDLLLWGDNPKVEWTPGECIHPDPRLNADYHLPWAYSVGVEGNVVRSMIEEFDDGEKYKPMRCQDCLVNWVDGDICWMCGKTCPFEFFIEDPLSFIPLGYVSDPGPRGIMVDRDEIESYVARDLELTLALFGDRTTQQRQEPISDVAEAISDFTNTPIRWSGHIQFNLPRRANRQYFQGVIDQIAIYWGGTSPAPVVILGHEMPENWDDPTLPIPLPEMPPPRDFSTWTRGYSSPNNNRFRFFDS